MRLLVVSTEFPPGPGGIGRHAHALCEELTAREWDVTAYVRQDYETEEGVLAFNASQDFRVIRAPASGGPFGLVRAIRDARRVMRAANPDVILASGRRAVWLVAGLGGRTPWMAVGHGTEFRFGSGRARALSRHAFQSADSVVCVSEHTRRVMVEAGFSPRRTRVIPNGADPRLFRLLPGEELDAARREWGLEGRKVLITVGRVGWRKGQDIVIRALPQLAREVPEAIYLMVGLPIIRAELEEIADRSGVADRVRFLGSVDDEALVRLENLADVFVMTSRTTEQGDFEGYGIAAVEAALCGVPAVVTLESGLVEAIEDGVTGVAVPPEDPAATASALARLLGDPALLRQMGDRARERALSEQTWAHRVREYERGLREIARPRA